MGFTSTTLEPKTAPRKTPSCSQKNASRKFFSYPVKTSHENRSNSLKTSLENPIYSYKIASGRSSWPSRDPIGESGGVNLYGFVGNDGINWADYLGMHIINLHSGNELHKGQVVLPSGIKATVKFMGDVSFTAKSENNGKAFPKQSGFMSLSVTAARDCDKCKWLQFVKREVLDKAGSIHVPTKNIQRFYPRFYRDGWHLDVILRPKADPKRTVFYYESGSFGRRSAQETIMLDRPSLTPPRKGGAPYISNSVYFHTFLVCDGKAIYHFEWSRKGYFDKGGKWQREYAVKKGQAINGLPAWANQQFYIVGYLQFNKKTVKGEQPAIIKNPLYVNP